ncbi:MAG: dTDP-4-dehydrorhamnose 3,5-epimerase [Cyclobacteriaceae bacterium]|nr:dTDP-4-dehydrorhamnose 3,5-epimerase [Cytophagales bacterium]MBX2899712.1 dTDP-4-dehydrorhamnose 3,5-epimerase [Cyclobacteriaceae bacterium]
MTLTPTPFSGLFILEPKVLRDARGYFMESFNARVFTQLGLNATFVQDNQSQSAKGVARGLHYQNKPYAQTKLVRVLSGAVLDIVLDLRSAEPTFGKIFTVELSAENFKQLWVPVGFAHGFVTLSEKAEILYKCDNYYHPQAEGGINLLDPQLNLQQYLPADVVLSEKDQKNPPLQQAHFTF